MVDRQHVATLPFEIFDTSLTHSGQWLVYCATVYNL